MWVPLFACKQGLSMSYFFETRFASSPCHTTMIDVAMLMNSGGVPEPDGEFGSVDIEAGD